MGDFLAHESANMNLYNGQLYGINFVHSLCKFAFHLLGALSHSAAAMPQDYFQHCPGLSINQPGQTLQTWTTNFQQLPRPQCYCKVLWNAWVPSASALPTPWQNHTCDCQQEIRKTCWQWVMGRVPVVHWPSGGAWGQETDQQYSQRTQRYSC